MPRVLFQGKQIFYRTEGSGMPVVLLHGFGEDGTIWNRQIKALAEAFFLLIPDIPGSGQSEMMDGKCMIEDYAEVIKTIAEKENLLSFSLIGHSMGGYITLAFAEKYPELLNSFGLFHSSAFADDDKKKATRRKGIDFIQKNGSEAFLKTSVPNLFSEQTKKERPELIDQLLSISKRISPAALVQYYEAMILRPERIPVLESFSKPVLFIMGKYDTSVPLDVSLEQCHIPANAVINILKHSGHMGMWEEDERSSACLLDFLKKI